MRARDARARGLQPPDGDEPLGGGDLAQLAWDVGELPWQVGAVLVLGPASAPDGERLVGVLAERLAGVPALRRRLFRPPRGGGRPFWRNDPCFTVWRHLYRSTCAGPGDEAALLDRVTALMAEPLPEDRPPWRATVLGGLAGGRLALVVVFHHALADGMAGLALLAALADPHPEAEQPDRAPAGRGQQERVGPPSRARPRRGRASGPPWAPRTTLNRPVGSHRRLAVVRADLAPVREAAHREGATVNDVVLVGVAGALGAVLAERAEPVETLVASVPVAIRPDDVGAGLGNRVGVTAVRLPVRGDPQTRLAAVAAATRARRGAGRRATSAALLNSAVRTLATAGLVRWLINRQRAVNTFVTNLRGPARALTFAGLPVTDLLPLTSLAGNVSVTFAVVSYAGTLTTVVTADPDRCPEVDRVGELLGREIDQLCRAAAGAGPDAADR